MTEKPSTRPDWNERDAQIADKVTALRAKGFEAWDARETKQLLETMFAPTEAR